MKKLPYHHNFGTMIIRKIYLGTISKASLYVSPKHLNMPILSIYSVMANNSDGKSAT